MNCLVYSGTFTWLTEGAACTSSKNTDSMIHGNYLQGKQTNSILLYLLGNSQEVAGLCEKNSHAVHDNFL